MNEQSGDEVARLVPTKSDAEIAADIKRRFDEAMIPVTAIMDEAVAQGLVVQFDGIMLAPPFYRHRVLGVRIIKILTS